MSRPAAERPDRRRGTVSDENGHPFSLREGETEDDFVKRMVVALHAHIKAPLPRPPELESVPPQLDKFVALGQADRRLIYFAACATQRGPIKIGLASNVSRRLREVQVGCPYPIDLMGTLPGGRAGEALLHRLFSDFKIHGEWFWPDAIVVRTIKALLREQKEAKAA